MNRSQMNNSDPALGTAIDAVAAACGVTRAVQRDLDRVRQITKDDRSPVTVADFAVQAIIVMALRTAFGEVLIAGEEQADRLRTDEHAGVRDAVIEVVRTVHAGVTAEQVLTAIDACDHDAPAEAYWTLDPIDGTKGFLRGQQYAIALAKIEHGQVVLGVMGCPNLSLDLSRPFDQADPHGAIYAAAAGSGSWQWPADDSPGKPRPVRCGTGQGSGPAKTVRVCESVEAAHSRHSDTQRVIEHLELAVQYTHLDSQCKYAVVARGQADAYLRMPTKKGYVENVWDHAAGMLIATEAGAVVTDITGAQLDFTHGRRLEANRGVVCAVVGVHGRIIEAIETLGIAATV